MISENHLRNIINMKLIIKNLEQDHIKEIISEEEVNHVSQELHHQE